MLITKIVYILTEIEYDLSIGSGVDFPDIFPKFFGGLVIIFNEASNLRQRRISKAHYECTFGLNGWLQLLLPNCHRVSCRFRIESDELWTVATKIGIHPVFPKDVVIGLVEFGELADHIMSGIRLAECYVMGSKWKCWWIFMCVLLWCYHESNLASLPRLWSGRLPSSLLSLTSFVG